MIFLLIFDTVYVSGVVDIHIYLMKNIIKNNVQFY